MKKTKLVMSVMASAALIVLSGCNSTDLAEQADYKSVTYSTGSVLGTTSGKVYETGAKLYDENNEVVGFIDIDGIVFIGPDYGEELCGGESIGLCDSAEFGEDGRLLNDCQLPPLDDALVPGEVVMAPPAVVFSCGDEL